MHLNENWRAGPPFSGRGIIQNRMLGNEPGRRGGDRQKLCGNSYLKVIYYAGSNSAGNDLTAAADGLKRIC